MTSSNDNPLLKPSSLPFTCFDFDHLKTTNFSSAIDTAIATGRNRLDQVRQNPPSFANTFKGLDHATEDLEFAYAIFHNLLMAEANSDLQKLAGEFAPKVSAFSNDILLDSEIFKKIEAVYNTRKSSDLTPQQIFYVEKVHRDFLLNGAALTAEQKTEMRKIDARMAELQPKFRENVLKATNAFELWINEKADLAGLPDSAINAARAEATNKGRPDHWLFTLQAPSFLPFMKFADKRELRQKMSKAYRARALGGEFDNQEIARELAHLAQKKAKILGAKSYAEHVLKTRMAETPANVSQFLRRLKSASLPKAREEVQEVAEFARLHGGPQVLESWDFAYYSEKLKQERYSFDEEALRPYFPLPQVLSGAFTLANRLFDLQFKPRKDIPVYHPDVQVFEVQKANDKYYGLLYLDLFARASKSPGAWMTQFLDQGEFRGQVRRPHVAIVGNFTRPVGYEPALLNFDEVSTLFHEFGHALHGLLSNVEVRALAGTSVYLDFVELPSQILENWIEEPEFLQLFAKHYKTGEPLKPDVLAQLKKAQRFQAAYLTVRQLSFAELDLAWYSAPPQSDESVVDFEERTLNDLALLPKVQGTNVSVSFSHIFGGGYAAGYYSYKWAEALDADAFQVFKEHGLLNREWGQRFEDCILSRGGTEHPMELYKKFRGRGPDPAALLARDGLKETHAE